MTMIIKCKKCGSLISAAQLRMADDAHLNFGPSGRKHIKRKKQSHRHPKAKPNTKKRTE